MPDLRTEVARAMYDAHVKRNKPWTAESLCQRERWLASADAAIPLIVEACAKVARNGAQHMSDAAASEADPTLSALHSASSAAAAIIARGIEALALPAPQAHGSAE